MTGRSPSLPERRRWLRRASLVAAALPLAGCGRRSGGRTTLRFWAMGREGEVAHELLAGFRAEQPHVELRIEQLPWTAAHEKLLTAFAGDATPDVAQIGNTWLPEMVALGAVEPLDTWLHSSPTIAPDDYFSGIWRTNLIDGKLQGLPWYVDTRLLYVRSDLLAKAGFNRMPDTWAGWQQAMLGLQRLGIAHPQLLPLNEFEPLLALALQQDDELLRDGGRRGNFSSPGFERALGFYLQMFERGFAPSLTNNQVSNLWQEFGRGQFALYISGPWNLGEFRRRLGPEQQSLWTTAPLPGPNGPGASIAGGSSLVMFRRSRARREAWALIEYLSRPEVQQQFYRLTGNLPPRRASWSADGLGRDPQALAFAQQLERVRPAPAVPEWERIAQEMQLFAARAAHDKSDPAAVARALDMRVDEFLAKRRWMLDRAR
ncbi:MAG TPA: sugar ABC transporter substrate-binding protein [Ideonella sp.]|uniref:sugar ABC transporter substrate-binding protein n=1 Tax=Ideonella sp. TaxID=1929293 RepID=UPI002E3211C2|nr:sugar ABC transporter substrate-binding protein [Ideonella sp.]HEX5683525.1 sugar ABC transporter substrate-binding protein [Ideonella sp.]